MDDYSFQTPSEGTGVAAEGAETEDFGSVLEAVGSSAPGVATGPQPPLTSTLDGLRYIASHKDLADAFGANAEEGLAHFDEFGVDEGRTTTFDPAAYLTQRPQVRAFLEGQGLSGTALHEAAARHFISRGRFELAGVPVPGTFEDALREATEGAPHVPAGQRPPTSELQGLIYNASNGDLADAFGADAQAGLDHYEALGSGEERFMTFDPQAYMRRLPNVRTHYEAQGFSGEELEIKAAEHFLNHGRYTLAGQSGPPAASPGAFGDVLSLALGASPQGTAAKSLISELDGLRYIASYENLANEFGPNGLRGLQHFDEFGQAEGKGILFDPEAYMAAHPGVRTYFESEGLVGDALLIAATRHFINQGRYEIGGLPLPQTFDAALYEVVGDAEGIAAADQPPQTELEGLIYIASHGDLADTLGANGQAGIDHHADVGNTEPRSLIFDPQAYMQRLPNVREHYEAQGLSGEELEVKATEHFLNHGQYTLSGRVKFADTLATLDQWAAAGVITQGQRDAFAADPQIIGDIDALFEAGSGRLDIETEGSIALAEISAEATADIEGVLAEGFDLATGPSAAQLTAIDELAQGHDSAFTEILINWITRHHPQVEVQFNPKRDVETGDPDDPTVYEWGDFRIWNTETDRRVDTPFFNWLDTKLEPDASIRRILKNELVGNYSPRGGRQFSNNWYTVTPALYATHNVVVRDAGLTVFDELTEFNRIVEVVGLGKAEATVIEEFRYTNGEKNHDRDPAGLQTIGARVTGRPGGEPALTIDIGDNFIDDGFNNARTSGFLREALETTDPDLLTGTTTILLKTEGQMVGDAFDVGDRTIIDLGGNGSIYEVGQGNANVTVVDATGISLTGGSGGLNLTTSSAAELVIDDDQDRLDVATNVTYTGENVSIDQDTDGGDNNVTVASGTTTDLQLDADGALNFTVGSGASLVDSTVQADNDGIVFTTQQNSLIDNVDVIGDAGEDQFFLGGQAIGSRIQLGDGNDYVQIQPTFEGDFSLEDTAASWMWADETEIHEQDIVELQGEGWEMVETPDGPKLIARDPETNEILSQINLSGESDFIESIYTVGPDNQITTLQDIPPEIRMKLAAFGLISEALIAIGGAFTPALALGIMMKAAYLSENGQLNLKTGALLALDAATAGSASFTSAGLTATSTRYFLPAVGDLVVAGAEGFEGGLLDHLGNAALTFGGIAGVGGPSGIADLSIDIGKGIKATAVVLDGIEQGSPLTILDGAVSIAGITVGKNGTPRLILGVTDGLLNASEEIAQGDISGLLTGALSDAIKQGLFDDLPPEAQAAGLTPDFIDRLIEDINAGTVDGKALVEELAGILGTGGALGTSQPTAPPDEPNLNIPFPRDEQDIIAYNPYADADADLNLDANLAPTGLTNTEETVDEDPEADVGANSDDDDGARLIFGSEQIDFNETTLPPNPFTDPEADPDLDLLTTSNETPASSQPQFLEDVQLPEFDAGNTQAVLEQAEAIDEGTLGAFTPLAMVNAPVLTTTGETFDISLPEGAVQNFPQGSAYEILGPRPLFGEYNPDLAPAFDFAAPPAADSSIRLALDDTGLRVSEFELPPRRPNSHSRRPRTPN